MKYRTTITGCGPEAFAFLSKELDLNFVIIFNEDAPVLTKEAVPVGETIEIY